LDEGSIVRINYWEKSKVTGRMTRTNIESVARDAGIFDEEDTSKYQPFTTVVGSGSPTPGVDEALLDMEVEEKKDFDVPPEKAYGTRNPRLMDHVTQHFLSSRGITPVRGLPVRTNKGIAIIRSVSGGRVRLDYNHPLAGQTLSYHVELIGEATDVETKIRWIIGMRLRRVDPDSHIVETEGKKATIELNTGDLPDNTIDALQSIIEKDLLEHVDEIEEVQFGPLETVEEAPGSRDMETTSEEEESVDSETEEPEDEG